MPLVDYETVPTYAYRAIVTRDRSSGRLHSRVEEVTRDSGEVRRILTDERCQADESGSFDIIPLDKVGEVMAESAEGAVCRFCGA